MTDAPKRIWINKVHGQHPEDWEFTDGKCWTKAQLRKKVEYVRADRIEELVEERDTARRLLGAATQMQTETQAKLTKAVEAMRNTLDKPRHADQSYAGLWADTMKEVRATLAELEGQ